MASSSKSTSALVTSSKKNHYDVFVTFRGEDTRNNFTDFLFDALERKDIFAFRDDTNLQKGESIGSELLRAIEGSQVFVAVFSRYYASSTWCLEELEKICECVQVPGKHVLPVFYDVDPSEVRKQSGIYHEAFVKHEQRFQQDLQKVSRWREALKQVGSIAGWDLRDKPQCAEIKKIVQKIMNILECKSSCNSKDLVGINSRIEALKNHLLLDSVDGVRAIGIWGMGGIGKTTLALDLYGQISHRFDASCFIDDVSKIYRLHDGPLEAQKQIIFQTLGIEHHQICNRYSATYLIRHRLCHERALLILDNVDQVEQLEKIDVHLEWLGAGSRIIIISRDEHILKKYGVDVVYKVPLLNWRDSYKLFCRKAFKVENIIMSNYQNLANEILRYANGLPLAIKVMGSFLFGCNVTEWKSALARLRESPDKDVIDVLQLSFDGLKHTEKEIFLDIACFFNSECEKYVKNILNCCGFHADIGLRVLINKSLISINGQNIEMHSLLEELGRKIVQNSSSNDPRKWSRLWSTEQLYDVIMAKMEKHVEAIVLKYTEEVDAEHLSKMSNLRLLIIVNHTATISGFPSCLSNKLRYVEWPKYPFKYLPTSFHPNELVELILDGSNIKNLWKNKKYLPNLRRLDLSDSRKLEKIMDFGEFPNLEWLNLEGCERLVELDPSIGLLRKLVYLNLKDCYNLVSIPNNIFCLSSLEYLNMRCCFKVFTNSRHLTTPGISESVPRVRSTSGVFKHVMLPHHLPFLAPPTNTYLHSLYCLREVDISFCRLSQVPDTIECLHWVERLNLGGNDFATLPSLRKLSKLVYLNLQHCKLLESLPQLPFPTAIGRERVEGGYYRPTGLFIFNCPKLGERECYSSMTFSWMMQFIKANPFYLNRIHIVSPGSEIPSWINNKSVGDSIRIDQSPIKHDNNIIGFVCCAVFSMAPHRGRFPSSAHMELVLKYPFNKRKSDKSLSRITVSVPVILNGSLVTITTKSSHIWIIYFHCESYHAFREIRFEIFEGQALGMEVKSCGYRWVCKQDLQEFNLTMMNHEKTLAQKCKILAIEDETQPEQESFISQVITTSQRRKSTSDNKSTATTISVVNNKQRKKSRTAISATEAEVSVEVPDSPVTDEVSTESPQKKILNLHIIGRFIGQFLNNCCQQGSTDTDMDTGYDTDTINSDAKSLVSEEDLDAVNSIIEDLNNCCQQGSTDTDMDTGYNTDTVNSDAESLVFEEDLDAVNSIIEKTIQTDIATSNVETDSPVEVADESLDNLELRKKFQLQLRQTAM
ncbi:putative TIR domain, winged helix-turn-helix DNA-binding domain-containing protein [Medicago truncatula]|uniref:ADP-ribosyl cyclase/cyclic ADP-ribose hydrolase n=1 Tax=Medicago truncatula TaxID=3880 RepID=G7IIM2_MEDTR|nr:disease resistance protein RUN1 [Medicago truncatula]XP_024632466.1 disease resistance protein RUN1 [Medicago truncatula]AES65465.2 disease resistance protein (TIR-NBS-LRR class) [Medicago truncatula]RHN73537.1 putative TIR domain, winged helix-turn-helix DNA-binding domain-containing protein [Medicago truncatula]